MASLSSASASIMSTVSCARCLATLALGDGNVADDTVCRVFGQTVRRFAPAHALAPLLFAGLSRALRPRRHGHWRQRLLPARLDADLPIPLEALPPVAADGDWTQAAHAPLLLCEALTLLSRREREAYLLRQLQGWPVARAAAALGLPAWLLSQYERRARHALHAMLALKGVSRHDGFPSLDAAIADVLTRAFRPDPALHAQLLALCRTAPDAGRTWPRLYAWLQLRRSQARSVAAFVACLLVLGLLLPAQPAPDSRGQASDAALLASDWPLDTLIHPLPQGEQHD